MGVIQRAMVKACPHVWFERSEVKDRHLVAKRCDSHSCRGGLEAGKGGGLPTSLGRGHRLASWVLGDCAAGTQIVPSDRTIRTMLRGLLG